jgi:hypothetical protein
MIIPKDATIAIEKVRDYLLIPRVKGDKSGYLALAGYKREDFWELLRDIREQLLPGDAIFQRRDEFGEYYELDGFLIGPNGKRLGVETIWMYENDGKIRFLTLFPDEGGRK